MKRLLSISFVCGVLTVAASAQTLNFLGVDTNKARGVQINYNGQNKNVYAGALKINIDGGDTLLAYCVDLDHWMSAGDSWGVNILPNVPGANGGLAENLYASFASSVDSKDKGAALQLAIWDSIVDGGDGLGNGNFKATSVSSSISSKVSTYLAARNQAPSQAFNFSYFQAQNHGQNNTRNQDLMYGEAVPEPASMAILAGVAALVARKRRKAA